MSSIQINIERVEWPYYMRLFQYKTSIQLDIQKKLYRSLHVSLNSAISTKNIEYSYVKRNRGEKEPLIGRWLVAGSGSSQPISIGADACVQSLLSSSKLIPSLIRRALLFSFNLFLQTFLCFVCQQHPAAALSTIQIFWVKVCATAPESGFLQDCARSLRCGPDYQAGNEEER